MADIKIRELISTDIPEAALLMKLMWIEHGQKTRLIDAEKMAAIDAEGYVRRHMVAGDAFFVALDGGGVVGTISGQVEDLPKHYNYDKRLLIDNLFILPEYRGQGIAGKLVQACEDWARKNKIKALAGEIWAFNDASRTVFTKQRYEPDVSFWYKVLD